MTDVDPEELEQLARSVAMSAQLGDRDRQEVIDALRRLAEIDKAKRRHPSSVRRGVGDAAPPAPTNRGGRSG